MNDKKFEDLFFSKTRDYLDQYLTRQCCRSPQTVRAYRDSLTVFRRFISKKKGIPISRFTFDDCTHEFILDYIEFLLTEGCARSTCNQRLAALKSYLWYASDCDVSLQQIALSISHVPFLKESEIIRETISEEDMKALLAAPGNSRIGIRDTAIMVILYDSAIRLSELLNLKLSDVNMKKEYPYLRIHGKGDKERCVTITNQTVDHIQNYLTCFHTDPFIQTDYLFYTVIHGQANRMSPGNVERILNKYASIIRPDHPNLPDRIYPHMMRRTRATQLYRQDVDLELVSRILGHSSTETTRIYAKPSLDMMKEAMEKASGQYIPKEEKVWPDDEDELAKLFGLR